MRILFAALVIALALIALRLSSTAGEREVERGAHVIRAEVVEPVDLAPQPSRAPSAPLQVVTRSPLVARVRSAPDGAPAQLEFPTNRGLLIVRVVRRSVPVEGASVELDDSVTPAFIDRDGQPGQDGDARTDASGRARFFVRPSRTVEVKVALQGEHWSANALYTTPFEGKSREMKIEVGVGATEHDEAVVQIVVRSFPSLAPLEGATLHCGLTPLDGQSLEADRVSDQNGRIEAPWRPGLMYELVADGHTKSMVEAPPEPPGEAGAGPFFIDLPQHARLWGRFHVDEGGRSASSIGEVRLLRETADDGLDYGLDYGLGAGGPDGLVFLDSRQLFALGAAKLGTREATVGRDGTWAIESIEIPFGQDTLPARTLIGIYGAPGASPTSRARRPSDDMGMRLLATNLALRPGDDVEIIDGWESEPPLSIRVTYGSGRPVRRPVLFTLSRSPPAASNLPIEMRGQPDAATVSLPLDEDGTAALKHLPVGTWYYSLHARRFGEVVIEGDFTHRAGRELAITVEGFESIAGHAVDVAGKRLGYIQVTLMEPSSAPRVRGFTVGSKGAFRFELVRMEAGLTLCVGRHVRNPNRSDAQAGIIPTVFVPGPQVGVSAGDHDIEIVVTPR